MAQEELLLRLPADLLHDLRSLAVQQGHAIEDVAVAELRRGLLLSGSPSRRGLLRGEHSGRLPDREESSAIHLTAPVINLVEGLLTDDVTIGEALQRCGDFGLGTLNKLDGEVVVLDGLAYQQGPTGAVRLVAREEKTPFMTLTRWRPDRARTMDFPTRIEHPELLAALEAQFASRNVFYAIRLVGSFESLRLRSVRKQAVDRPLVEVAEDQAVFELGPSSGVLVGFWSPAFIGSTLTVPGYHFHYLSDDRQRGGHVLHTVLLQGSAQIMELHHAVADMPRTEAYMGADLANDAAEALGKAE